jgi:DNA-directed RNA polymerase specialized sigma subunit
MREIIKGINKGVIIIKNYYQQLSELRIAETRLKTLQEQKELLETKATKTTSTIKEVVTFGGSSNDKMTDYVIKCEELNKKIETAEEEIRILKKGLQQMNEILKNISGIEERVFRLYYIENKNPTQISFIIPCARDTVYRYLRKIDKKVKVNTK